MGYACLVTGRSFLQNALGEGLGGFDEGNVVERDEGGKGCVGTVALHTCDVGVWAVEGEQVGVRGGALEESVEAPAVTVAALAHVPFETVGIGQAGDPGGHGRKHTGPSHF